MNALQGQLDEGVLANLLQYLSLNQAGGCLTLRHPRGMQGHVFLEGGRVVHVVANPLGDVDALSLLLSWTEGRFLFRAQVAAPQRSLDLPTDTLLLEASVRADTARRSGAGVSVDADSVLLPRRPAGEASTVAMTLRAVHLLRYLDGNRTLREAADRMRAPLGEVLAAAGELLQQDLVEFRRVPMAGASFVDDLTRCTIDIMGPMGEIVVEDALFDLGLDPDALPLAALDELIEELAAQFRRPDWQRAFLARAEALRRRPRSASEHEEAG